YVSVGDGGCAIGNPSACAELNTNSRRLDIPNGKILLITRNGNVPASNPFVGMPGSRRCTEPGGVAPNDGPCTETFAFGLRNPFRFAIYPGTNRVYANDVGQSTSEEIDRILPGRDYGWNVREGFCLTGSTTECTPDPQYTDPLFAYDRSTDCRSITGGAFVPPGLWGPPYEDQYIFADFTCNSVFRLVPQQDSAWTAEPFFPADGPVELVFGPGPSGQALYYLEYFTGELHRVTGPTV
ncbi:MAG: PQQ-dependent sugar dehydrogenase, partial [Candidatus Nanopelagicales bacterium]